MTDPALLRICLNTGRSHEMDTTGADPNVKAAACAYLLVCLMQRLETRHPGLIGDCIAGVSEDRRSLPRDAQHPACADAIFKEAFRA